MQTKKGGVDAFDLDRVRERVDEHAATGPPVVPDEEVDQRTTPQSLPVLGVQRAERRKDVRRIGQRVCSSPHVHQGTNCEPESGNHTSALAARPVRRLQAPFDAVLRR